MSNMPNLERLIIDYLAASDKVDSFTPLNTVGFDDALMQKEICRELLDKALTRAEQIAGEK